jgi:hypothetical protein
VVSGVRRGSQSENSPPASLVELHAHTSYKRHPLATFNWDYTWKLELCGYLELCEFEDNVELSEFIALMAL